MSARFRPRLSALSSAILAASLAPAAPLATAATDPAAALQGSARITGTVESAERGELLRGAIVSIESLNLSTVTDGEGRFTLRRLSPGTYTVKVSYIDREPFATTLEILGDETEELKVALVRRGQTAGIEEVVVVGRLIADAEAAALSRQRAADSVKNIVAADSIGRFPDQNAADALGRVPGISIERDQGQARFVNVRGAPAQFTNIAFNGVAAPTPSSGGRQTRFDTISNHIIKSIEVQKAVTPDVPADSIGGFINVETNGAFDKEGFYADIAAAGGIRELGGGPIEQYQFTASNTFAQNSDGGDMFGVLVSASYYNVNQVTDNTENRFSVQDDGLIWSDQADYRIYRLNRSNTSFNTRLDFRPSENHSFYANFIYSDFQDFEIRDQHVYDFDDSWFGHPESDADTPFDPATSNPVRGTIFGVGVDTTSNVRTDVEAVIATQFGGEHDLDTWHVEWVGGFNNSESSRDSDNAYFDHDIPAFRENNPDRPGVSVTYDYTDPDKPITQVFNTVVNPDTTVPDAERLALGQRLAGAPTDFFVFDNVEQQFEEGIVDEIYFQFDVERPWAPFGITSDLKFGGRYSNRNATLDARVFTQEDIDVPFRDILSGRPSRATFPQPLMYEFDDSAAETLRASSLAEATAQGAFLNGSDVWEQYYDVDEIVTAVYAMNTFRWDKFDIIVGARVEYTDMSGIGNQPFDEDAIDDVLEGTNAPVSLADLLSARDGNGDPILGQVNAENDYVDFFPALHVNYRPTEDLVVRFAYTETILRPSYSEFAPNRVVGEDSDEQAGLIFISGGNPALEPYRAQNLDLYVERYLPYRGILSLGLFAKNIDDPIFNAQQELDGGAFGFPNSRVRLSGPLNGSDGEIRGFEATYSQQFGFLPSPFDGFGVQLNYTYAQDDARTPPLFNEDTGQNDGLSRSTGLSGASDQTYNASVFFEKYGVSARLSYQYRSEWLNAIDLQEERLDRFWDERPSVDFSFRYSISDNWLLFLDANNLTDEFGRRFNGDTSNVYEVEGFGRSYLFGVRASM